ncbi:MAG: leucine-rich repeat domain-containing protein [Anaerolineales bacterium]|nr:leucine-rich repeat domain-containing protein [Anaerolineales bacterium]
MSYQTALDRIRAAAESGATALDLSFLGLTALPAEIGALASLQDLDLRENQLTALPPEIGALASLQTLHLSDNQLTALPAELWRLPWLKRLDISFNPLPGLPPELWQKTDWEELNLGGLNLTALPAEIGALASLQNLDLSRNQLTALPAEIGALASLQTLYLSDNQLTALPPEIGELASLQTLGLSHNQLTALPPEIGELASLQDLDHSHNQLTDLPPEIGELASLQTLNLRENQLTDLPLEIGQLASLQTLDLRENQLTALPPEIGELANLQTLRLHGNPLTLALPRALLGDEILGGDAQGIFRFYRAIWQAGRPLGEARLLFVGEPAVGKTQLARRLRGLEFEENSSSTMTVETHVLPLGGLTAHLWDFGGQDFMHPTHPFFFSARCVYVLVLNVRQTYEQNRVEYWLRTIRAFGGQAPVIVAGNQADAKGHVLDLPQNRLQREFPQTRPFLQTSAKDERGLEKLRDALTQALDELPHTRVLFAQSHLAVKAALEEEKTRRDIIPYDYVRDLCARQGMEDPEDQKTLLALLHDLGVVLDFRDEGGEPLSPDGVLNPNWVTGAVYRLLTDQELRGTARGRLTPEMTRRILADYQPWHRDLILKLLRRFELAYPAAEGVFYLPNTMPQDEPPAAADPAWAGGLTFEYGYPELPESVITRFIVRVYEHIESGLVWRWGVILALGGNRALVRASAAARRLEIHVLGAENTRRDLLAFIRGHFYAIHKTFTESAGQEAFPLQEFICPPEYPGLRLDYRKLLTYERDGLREIPETWQNRTIRLDVSAVLNGFVTPEARREERKRLFPEEEERMAKEIHYHEHKHFEARDVSGAVVNLGEGNTTSQRVEHSFNTPSNPELAPLLEQLTAAVQAMLPHLEAGSAAETAEDLQRLQEELQKPKPRRQWYSVSIEGLKKAAQNVGEIGAPVIELAGKLLMLLG